MSDALNLVWLVAAILVSVLIIVVAFRLSRPLAGLLGQALKTSSVTASQTLLLARLLMLGIGLVISQAILRWPLALLLAADRSQPQIDSEVASTALAAVLVLLVWMYEAARPIVQAATLQAIDAAVPTTGEVLVAEPTRTASLVSTPVASPTSALTVVAPLFGRPPADDATEVAGQAAEATVVAQRPEEPTVMTRRPQDQDTLVASPQDDKTLRRDP
jgi:hypothetical protein